MQRPKLPFYFSDYFLVFSTILILITGLFVPFLFILLIPIIILLVIKNNKFSVVSKELYKQYGDFDNVQGYIYQANNDLQNVQYNIQQANQELNTLNTEIFYSYIHANNYDELASAEIKNQMSLLSLKEKDLISQEQVIYIQAEGGTQKWQQAQLKQILRCFNAESDLILSQLTIKNVDASRNKLIKSFESLNKLFAVDQISIRNNYLELKLEMLNLMHQYQVKLEQEKEIQKAIREQMIEEEKVRREIEAEKKKIEKEEKQFNSELSKLMGYLSQSQDDIQKQLYLDKINELNEKIVLLEKDKENVLQRETNTRAGFVYVISNIGSFGENIYKIGMTRRLEPMERIDELSSASVPFNFDVHAMIFSEDAPALETALHNAFRSNEVNRVNHRKEFFKVSLEDIERVVKENYSAVAEFTLVASAEQYRESLRLENDVLK